MAPEQQEEAWMLLCHEHGFDKRGLLSEIDHVLPVAEGGTDDMENLQTLCRGCHKLKTKEQKQREAYLRKLIGKKQRKTMLGLSSALTHRVRRN